VFSQANLKWTAELGPLFPESSKGNSRPAGKVKERKKKIESL